MARVLIHALGTNMGGAMRHLNQFSAGAEQARRKPEIRGAGSRVFSGIGRRGKYPA